MSVYQEILLLLEDDKRSRIFEFVLDEPLTRISQTDNFSDKLTLLNIISLRFGLRDLFLLFRIIKNTQSLSELLDHQITTKRKVMLPLLRFLINTHLRRQLERIHSLFLQEIIIPINQNFDQKEIQELRNISEDIKKYIDILPNPKRSITALIAILSSVFGIVQFSGLPISKYLSQYVDISTGVSVTGFLLVGIMLFLLTTSPILQAFRAKRAIFLDSNLISHNWDVYFQNENTYKNSVYKLEDDLYEKINTKELKPKEIPVDKIIFSVMSLTWLIFLILGILFNWLIPTTADIITKLLAMMLTLPIVVFTITPYFEYRRRRKHGLV